MIYDEENTKKRMKRDLGLALVILPIIIIIMKWEIVWVWVKNLFE